MQIMMITLGYNQQLLVPVEHITTLLKLLDKCEVVDNVSKWLGSDKVDAFYRMPALKGELIPGSPAIFATHDEATAWLDQKEAECDAKREAEYA